MFRYFFKNFLFLVIFLIYVHILLNIFKVFYPSLAFYNFLVNVL